MQIKSRLFSLLQNMGIKDEFHQEAILDSIDQLQNKGNCKQNEILSSELIEAHKHKLAECSFHNLYRCDKCGGFLRGLFHQGQICKGTFIS